MSCCGLKICNRHQGDGVNNKPKKESLPESKWPEDEKDAALFCNSLDEEDFPAKSRELTFFDVDEVWKEVHALERLHRSSSRYRRVGRTIEPVINFFIRFSPIVDTMVQYGSSPSTVIWGALKGILIVAHTSVAYFYYVENALGRLGDILPIAHQYEKMFNEEKRVEIALLSLYNEIYLFIEKIRVSVGKNSFRRFFNNVGKAFDEDFKNEVAYVERYTRIFNDEVTLAHRRRVDESSEKLQGLVRAVSDDTSLHMSKMASREERENEVALLSWLSKADFHEDFHRAAKRRSPGTGEWLLHHSSFTSWSNFQHTTGSRTLWVNGRPGSGKTVLSAAVIRHLQELNANAFRRSAPVTYFYCDSGDSAKASAFQICASILSQILIFNSTVPSALRAAFERAKIYGRLHASTSDDLFSVLESAIRSLASIYIIIDGLDECGDPGEAAKCFEDIAVRLPAIRLCILSRKVPAIENVLGQVPTIALGTNVVQPDIDKYLMEALKILPTKQSEVYLEAIETISCRADGMFLFAFLSVETLKTAVDSRCVMEAVAQIPSGLDGIYTRILKKIECQPPQRRRLAGQILKWVCYSTRPLQWMELQYALSWDQQTKDFSNTRRPFKTSVLELCAPLIEYRPLSDSFHVAHFSVSEFLCNHTGSTEQKCAEKALFPTSKPNAHLEIAEALLSSIAASPVSRIIKVDPFKFPLVQYATENWCHHLSSTPFDSGLAQQLAVFTSSSVRRYIWIIRYLVFDKNSFPLQRLAKLQKSVHDWKNGSPSGEAFVADDLADLQQALIKLDELPPSIAGGERLSNFERLMTVRDLARAYTMSRKLDQGIEIFSSALTRMRELGGEESLGTPWLLNSLGILYDQNHQTELATASQLQALAIQEKSLPSDHLDLTLTINELGRMKRHQGLYKEAEAYHLRALHILEQILPETDLQIIWTINTLARSYRREGRSSEAIMLHRKAIIGQTAILGEDHPHVLWTSGDIARCLRDQNDIDGAIEILQDVHVRRSNTIGPLHPDTLWTLNDLGLLYEALEDVDKAEELHSKALRGQREVLGVEHAHTKWTIDRLAALG